MLSTSIISPGLLSRGWSMFLFSQQLFHSWGTCALSPPSFLSSSAAWLFLHLLPFILDHLRELLDPVFVLEKVASEGACELLSVLTMVCSCRQRVSWDSHSFGQSEICTWKFHLHFHYWSTLALESGALAFKALFRNYYSLLVAFYCKKITITQQIGKAVPLWPDPGTCINWARRCRTDPLLGWAGHRTKLSK